ncbi:MAG: AAA family ATPase [Candidatus Symbiothrix sp.]|nr:AAA family ATPase [Candidatus Symbiothrix sp.]
MRISSPHTPLSILERAGGEEMMNPKTFQVLKTWKVSLKSALSANEVFSRKKVYICHSFISEKMYQYNKFKLEKMYINSIKKLIKWKLEGQRKPLVFLGARQVGKTWLIQEFGKTEYKQMVYINFERATALQEMFLPDLDIKRLITNFEIYSK